MRDFAPISTGQSCSSPRRHPLDRNPSTAGFGRAPSVRSCPRNVTHGYVSAQGRRPRSARERAHRNLHKLKYNNILNREESGSLAALLALEAMLLNELPVHYSQCHFGVQNTSCKLWLRLRGAGRGKLARHLASGRARLPPSHGANPGSAGASPFPNQSAEPEGLRQRAAQQIAILPIRTIRARFADHSCIPSRCYLTDASSAAAHRCALCFEPELEGHRQWRQRHKSKRIG